MTDSTRPRGRPKGATDSYKRTRTRGKKPSATTLEIVGPPIRDLIFAARTVGKHIGTGRPHWQALEEEENMVTQLIAAIGEAIQNANNS